MEEENLFACHVYQDDVYIDTYTDIDRIYSDERVVIIGNSESGISITFPKSKGYSVMHLFRGDIEEK